MDSFLFPSSNSRQFCPHSSYRASVVPRSDGVPTLREFCVECGSSASGSNLGLALPMVSDKDVVVQSYKYAGKTLGDIFSESPDYLVWLVRESKASDRVRKSAARILCGVPYSPPSDGDVYPGENRYQPQLGWECIRKIQADLSIPTA